VLSNVINKISSLSIFNQEILWQKNSVFIIFLDAQALTFAAAHRKNKNIIHFYSIITS